ncbi:hypothetical protein GCM10023093_22900 [Nemorincola caseinilytica]|uniref:YD repeat-containing protein n=1 Tax=Nemorincola caseinilytica TaxID=2054315 RepID=A0ABP8NKF6_9BACT
MKIVTTILLAILSLTAVHAQVKNDLKRLKLRGDVKTVTEYEYAVPADSKEAIKGDLRSKSISKFSNGYRTEFATYSPKGDLLSRSVYNYNDSGRLVDVKRYRGDGGLNVTTVYTYDKAGNETEESNYDPSGMLFMTGKSTYDLNGNRIVYNRYNQFGHLFLRSNIKYDKKGNEVQEREFDSHESLQFVTTYGYDGYDKQGNWLQRVTLKNDVPRTIIERELTY